MRVVLESPHHTIQHGWSDELAKEIVAASRQTAILQYTPSDAARRFKDLAAANNWHNSTASPEVYSLRDRTSQRLAGLAWFSWQHNKVLEPIYNATFAIRLYDNARGKRLSYPFAANAHADFEQQQKEALTGLWLDTDVDNQSAHHLYHKLGYQTLTQVEHRLVMTRAIDNNPPTLLMSRST